MIEQQEIYYAYTGNGVTTQFAYGCRIFAAADLVVTVDGAVKALGVDYTITGVDDIGGGEITFVPAAVPANGVTVELERVLNYTRGTSYVQNGGFQPDIVDKDQDYQTALLQQLEYRSRFQNIIIDTSNQKTIIPVFVDASVAPAVVALPESGETVIYKTDESANKVIITPTAGKTVLRQPTLELQVQDDFARLIENNGNWFRV